MSAVEYDFDGEVQDDILRLIVKDPIMSAAAEHWIEPGFFKGGARKWFADFVISFFRKYSVAPTKGQTATELLHVMKTKRVTIDRGKEIQKVMTEAYDKPLSGSREYTVDVVYRFARQRSWEQALMDGVQHLERGDHDKMVEIMEGAAALSQMSIDSGGYFFFEAREERVRRRGTYDESPVLPTGILELDINFRRGGLVPGEIGLWMAPKGGGKSIALCSVARRAVFAGWNVALYSFEMSTDQISARLDSGFSNVDMWDLEKDARSGKDCFFENEEDGSLIETVTEKEEKSRVLSVLETLGTRFPRSLMIKRYPNKSKTINDIRRHLHTLHLLHNWKPQLIIVDYCGIVKPSRLLKDRHLEMQEVLEEFRALCIDMDAVGWTAGQINRSGARSDVADGTHAAGSWDQLFTADHIITININDEERRNNTMRLYLDKIRDGIDHMTIGPLVRDWSKMIFARRTNKTVEEARQERDAYRSDQAKITEKSEKAIECKKPVFTPSK